jgi:hypothetical protein
MLKTAALIIAVTFYIETFRGFLLKISSRDPGRTSLNSPLTSDPEE